MVKMLRFWCLVRAMGLIRKLGSDYRLVTVERDESIAGVAMMETGYGALTSHSFLHFALTILCFTTFDLVRLLLNK
jgi:hypothetical protein